MSGGFIGSLVSDPIGTLSNVVSDPGQAISNLGSEANRVIEDTGTSIDQTVRHDVPGGWGTVAAVAGAVASGGLLDTPLPTDATAQAAADEAAQTAAYNAPDIPSPDLSANPDLQPPVGEPTISPPEVPTEPAPPLSPPTPPEAPPTPDITPNPGSEQYSLSGQTPAGPGINPNLPSGAEISMASLTGAAPALAEMGGGTGLTLPEATVLGDAAATGTLSAAGVTAADQLPALGDPTSFVNTGALPAAATAAATSPLASKLLQTGLSNLLGGSSSGSGLIGSGGSMLGSSGSTGGALPGTLSGTSLAGAPVSGNTAQILQQLKQMYPQLNNVDPRILNSVVSGAGNKEAGTFMQQGLGALGGSTQNPYSAMVQTMLGQSGGKNPNPELPIAKDGGGTEDIIQKWRQKQSQQEGSQMIGQGLKMLNATNYGLKDGGQPHVPEFITGATGHYVKGKGDGQSDDIPAMLADGEYVFDADTVASLGNGSSDAGAKLLDHFRESLRKHKRSAPVDKIPPPASPLLYMKEALRKHKEHK